jgi:hypothetical protein
LQPIVTKKNGKGYSNPQTEAIKAVEQVSKETLPEQLSKFNDYVEWPIFN